MNGEHGPGRKIKHWIYRTNTTYRIFGLALILAAGGEAADYGAAQAKLDAYRAGRDAMLAAAAANDMAKAEQLRTHYEADLRAARELFEQAGIKKESEPAPLLAYAETLEAVGDYDLAAEALDRAVRTAPYDAALWGRLGKNLFLAGPGKRREAFSALRQALDLDAASPDAAQTWIVMGDLHRKEEMYDLAREDYEKALAISPEDVRARILLAAMKIRGGAVLEGSKDLDALGKAAQPYDAETRVLLREVLADFEEARRWFPDAAEHHAAYARLMYRAGRPADALLAGTRATQLAPKDFEMWNFMAAIYTQIGNAAQARTAYERSLEAKPDQPHIREALAAIPSDGE